LPSGSGRIRYQRVSAQDSSTGVLAIPRHGEWLERLSRTTRQDPNFPLDVSRRHHLSAESASELLLYRVLHRCYLFFDVLPM
jgi:hypothetical protein